MVITEIVLSAFLQALFQSLISPYFSNVYTDGEQNILEKMKTLLLTIDVVVIDAEEKQITHTAVQSWLNNLKDVVYQAEDVLEDIITKASTPKDLKSKLKQITQKLEDLALQKNTLSLVENKKTHMAIPESTSLPGEHEVIGRQTEKEKIKEFLMADNENEMKKSVVAIVGIGGVGKTTVAQLLYNEKREKDDFTVKAWIHVSAEDTVTSLSKTIYKKVVIYKKVSKESYEFIDLDQLHCNLKKELENQKFLLVLDDMWSEDFEEWNRLCKPFASAAKGSRIIVTTRSHHVATTVCASYTHILQPLSFEECRDLFMEQISAQEQDLNTKLRILAREVVDKCKGLPLAAKAFGGLLRSNREDTYWRRVLNSKIWTPPTVSTNILPVLRVSYHYLPPHLKRCFAYCSIFPKGYAFHKKMVVLLWMAEGLLQQESTERMEDVGDGYFSELVSRSLFQQTSDTEFVMHELINELAQFAAGKFCFKFENPIQGLSGITRHLSYIRDQYSAEEMTYEVLGKAMSLRTFLPLSLSNSPQICSLNRRVRVKLLPDLTCLRVLSLSHYSVEKLPSDIFEKMRNVRYLDLSRTNLQKLPTSVRFLYSLQTLLLSFCSSLIKLDKAICNLVSLERIDLTETRLKQMPKHFGKLKRLQTLTTFIVGAGVKGVTISELRDLTELRGKLTILELHRVGDTDDAVQANLESKTHLKEIDLVWRPEPLTTDNDLGTRNEDAVFEKLRPSTQIEEITVKRYYGKQFPKWMSDSSFSNITCLSLTECQRCELLPSLGRLSGLKELHISKMKHLRSIGPEFYSSHPEQPFKSLQTLSFEDMPNWEHWEDVRQLYGETLFPNLEELFIVNCPKLTGTLPGLFPSLTSLQIHQSAKLVFQLDANKYTKLQRLN